MSNSLQRDYFFFYKNKVIFLKQKKKNNLTRSKYSKMLIVVGLGW